MGADTVSSKSQLNEAQKVNEMKTQEINAIQKMHGEAKANSNSITCQFDDAKKVYQVEKKRLKADLEIATKAKLEVIRYAEAETASLKTKLDESQKFNEMKTQKLKSQLNESHKENGKKTLELNKTQEKIIEVKANAASSKCHLDHAKKKYEAEMQVLQKKLLKAT